MKIIWPHWICEVLLATSALLFIGYAVFLAFHNFGEDSLLAFGFVPTLIPAILTFKTHRGHD